MALAGDSNDPAKVLVIAQMAPVMMLHMSDLLGMSISKLTLEEFSYEEDAFKAEKLHLTALKRHFTLRQSILGQQETTLACLLKGLTLFSGIENLEVQLPLTYLADLPCLRSHWTQVCCPCGRSSICLCASSIRV